MLSMAWRRTLALGALLALAGCAAAPPDIRFRGQPMPALDGIRMTCEEPYEFVQNCSQVTGAKLVVVDDRLQFKVAGTADGRTVLAMPDKLEPSRLDHEQVHDRMVAIAAANGAALTRVEAVIAGPKLLGFVFSTDRDLFAVLRAKAKP